MASRRRCGDDLVVGLLGLGFVDANAQSLGLGKQVVEVGINYNKQRVLMD